MKTRKKHAAGGSRRRRGTTGRDYSASLPPAATKRKPYVVNVHGERTTAWGAYIRREDAEAVASKLRQHGMSVTVVEAKP